MQNRIKEKVPVPIELQRTNTIVPITKLWDQETIITMKPWYIEALEGEDCALFFIHRIDSIVRKDKILERELKKIINQWLEKPDVYRALNSGYLTPMDIDELEIPIAYYPEIVARIKEAYKQKIKR